MKYLISLITVILVTTPVFGATSRSGAYVSVDNGPVMRATASVNQLQAMANSSGATKATGASATGTAGVTNKPSIRDDIVPTPGSGSSGGDGNGGDGDDDGNDTPGTPDTPPVPDDDPSDNEREKERLACINNNLGVGNTYVWASRYSNTKDYVTMVEDIEHPENNVCFVRVELTSKDPRISVSDLPPKYFVWRDPMVCGSWVDEDLLVKRIMDATRKGRTWGTIGAGVGSAAVGVGVMELWGNKAINGAVEGQKSDKLDNTKLFRSKMLEARHANDIKQYADYAAAVRTLAQACPQLSDAPEGCRNISYKDLCADLDLHINCY